MNGPKPLPRLLLAACMALLLAGPAHADDDDAPAPASTSALPELDAAQQTAVGLVVGHPVAAKPPKTLRAYGRVLDPATLIGDIGQLSAARAAEHAAAAESARLHKLYHGGAGTSLKALQAAEAAQAKASASARSKAAAFTLQWGPVAKLSSKHRKMLIDALTDGDCVLLTAIIPGRISLAHVPDGAQVDVDGIRHAAQVLGVLGQAASGAQAASLLLRLDHPPLGLGVGARVPVTLAGASQAGVVVPDGALFYGEQGAYVYRPAGKADGGKTRFAPVPVTLLQSMGDGWLVSGIDAGDAIVTQGAGVLWSLQGLQYISDEDDD